MRRGARVVGQVLQQLNGEGVDIVAAHKREQVGGLDAKAGKRRVDVVRRARGCVGAEGNGEALGEGGGQCE